MAQDSDTPARMSLEGYVLEEDFTRVTDQANAYYKVLVDLHHELGIEWGGNPYEAINKLKARPTWEKEDVDHLDDAIGDLKAHLKATALPGLEHIRNKIAESLG